MMAQNTKHKNPKPKIQNPKSYRSTLDPSLQSLVSLPHSSHPTSHISFPKRITRNINNPRIISGIYKGKKLNVAEETRPITDRVKKTLFDLLSPVIADSVCLDLYAGTGSIGIEALSNGARFVDFVEKSNDAVGILINNLRNIDIPKSFYEVIKNDVNLFLNHREEAKKYDIIFIDPPFNQFPKLNLKPLHYLCIPGMSIVCLKLPTTFNEFELPEGATLLDERKIGENKLMFWQYK